MKKIIANTDYEKIQKPEPPKIDPIGHGQGSRYVKASQGVFEDTAESKLYKKRYRRQKSILSIN